MTGREPPPVAGKSPPHNLSAEAAVVSAMLCSAEACDEALDVVRADDFFSDRHRLVVEAVTELHAKGEPVDAVMVAAVLRGRGTMARVGGSVFLSELIDATPAVANVRAHAALVRQLRRVRAWIAAGQRWAAMGYGEAAQAHPDGYMQDAAAAYQALLDDTGGEDIRPIGEVVREVVERSRSLQDDETQLAGLDTGFGDLNDRTGGHQAGDLTVLAARPGMGKTAASVNMMLAASKHGDVYSWTGEMPCEQMVARFLAQESECDLRRLRQGRLSETEWSAVYSASERLSARHIWVDDRPAIGPLEFRTRARRYQMRARQLGRELALAVADYLQLMTGTGDSREQEISFISRSLKGAAKSLGVPVIALSQLNRGVELREDKTPRLSDLRESGAIEQDADNVLFLYRPGYYLEQKGKEDDTGGRTQLTVAKQRNGPTGSMLLKWWGGCAKFGDWERWA